MNIELPTINPQVFAARIQGWRKRRTFEQGRLKFYRDCVDSKLILREFAALRAAQMERRGNPMYEPVLDIARDLQSGKTAAESFKGTAPNADVAMIAAYEKNNRLEEGFRQVVKMVSEQMALKKLVRKSLTAPVLYLTIALGMISFGIPMLIEEVGPLLPPESRSVDQVILVNFSSFMSTWGAPIEAIFVGGLVAMFASMNVWTGNVRRKLDATFPPLMMNRAYQSAIFLKTLAIQLSVTPKIEDALAQIWSNSTPWQRMYIELIQDRLPHHRLSPLTAFDVGFMDSEMIDSLTIISRKGTAEEAIMTRAVEAGELAIDSIEKSIGVLKSVATLVAGLMIVWTAYSLILGLVKVTTESMNQAQSRTIR